MKDIVIRKSDIRRECIVALICFVVAFFINIGAIIGYGRPWVEMFSQIGYVVVLSIGIYVIALPFRLLASVLFKAFGIKRK